MYGAIIGDLAGSIYEYDQLKQIKSIQMKNLIEICSFYSDDTILTIAVLDAILHDRNYDYYLRKYIQSYQDYHPNFTPYFKSPFSPNIMKWSQSTNIGTSCGNGAMMRISPVGYLFDTEEEVIENARLATIPSHDSLEAIDSATIVALIIFYLRQGFSKEDVIHKLHLIVSYTPFKKFNTTCSETLGNCLYAFFNSTSFSDAIRKALSMGGDTDTNAAIVGSMAEALYGIDSSFIQKVNQKIPDEFVKMLEKTKKYSL